MEYRTLEEQLARTSCNVIRPCLQVIGVALTMDSLVLEFNPLTFRQLSGLIVETQTCPLLRVAETQTMEAHRILLSTEVLELQTLATKGSPRWILLEVILCQFFKVLVAECNKTCYKASIPSRIQLKSSATMSKTIIVEQASHFKVWCRKTK